MNSVDSSGETKSAHFIAENISAAIKHVGSENVVQVITDNAANCKAAWTLLSEEFPRIVCSPYATHTLDLLLEDWGKLSIAAVVAKAADLVKFINGHEGSRALFKKHSPGKGLLQPADTRFGTNVIMVERLLELKDNLQEMCASRKYKELVTKKSYNEIRDLHTKRVISESFWSECRSYIDVNKPVYQVLRAVDGGAPYP